MWPVPGMLPERFVRRSLVIDEVLASAKSSISSPKGPIRLQPWPLESALEPEDPGWSTAMLLKQIP